MWGGRERTTAEGSQGCVGKWVLVGAMFRALQGRGLWTEESRMMRWNQAQQPVEGFWGTSLVGGPPDKLRFKSKIAQPIDSDSD